MSWRVVELPEEPLLTCAARAGQRLIVSLVASERRSRACGDICRSNPYRASVGQTRWRSERGWNVSLPQRTSQAGEFERKPSSLSRGTEGSIPLPPARAMRDPAQSLPWRRPGSFGWGIAALHRLMQRRSCHFLAARPIASLGPPQDRRRSRDGPFCLCGTSCSA